MTSTPRGVLFRSEGGLGKQVMGTVVAKQIKEKYPNIPLHVQTSFPSAFGNLKFVDKIYGGMPSPDFYEIHKEFEILHTEPYVDFQYRMGNQHLIDVWCRRLGLDLPQSKTPIINLRPSEINTAEAFFNNLRIDPKIPIVAFQYVGGTPYTEQNSALDPTRVKQYRDYQYDNACKFVKRVSEMGIAVLHVGLQTEKAITGAISLPHQLNGGQFLNPRYLMAILNKCAGGLFIDSSAMHIFAGLGKKNAVVMWGGTRPSNLGYSFNCNMIGKCDFIGCNRPDGPVYDISGDGMVWECPYNARCMDFKVDELVEAVKLQLEKNSKPQEQPETSSK